MNKKEILAKLCNWILLRIEIKRLQKMLSASLADAQKAIKLAS